MYENIKSEIISIPLISFFLPSVAPKIIMPDTVTVRAGSKMTIEAIVAGKPAPFCKWKQGNEDVLTSDRLSVVKTLTTCTLIIKNVTRRDSGYYSLSAENSTAKVNQILKVIVMGQLLQHMKLIAKCKSIASVILSLTILYSVSQTSLDHQKLRYKSQSWI